MWVRVSQHMTKDIKSLREKSREKETKEVIKRTRDFEWIKQRYKILVVTRIKMNSDLCINNYSLSSKV